MEELTWMDVRDAVKNGKKHRDHFNRRHGAQRSISRNRKTQLRAACQLRSHRPQMGNALCAPIIKLVPEGDLDPPTIHMFSPGTISMREETFRMMLEDTARSLRKSTGFKNIIFIGDSGGNQAGMKAVAEKLNGEWKERGRVHSRVLHVFRSRKVHGVARHQNGSRESGSFARRSIITLNMLIDDPQTVRWEPRVKANKATINGFSIARQEKGARTGQKSRGFPRDETVEASTKPSRRSAPACSFPGTESHEARWLRSGFVLLLLLIA